MGVGVVLFDFELSDPSVFLSDLGLEFRDSFLRVQRVDRHFSSSRK